MKNKKLFVAILGASLYHKNFAKHELRDAPVAFSELGADHATSRILEHRGGFTEITPDLQSALESGDKGKMTEAFFATLKEEHWNAGMSKIFCYFNPNYSVTSAGVLLNSDGSVASLIHNRVSSNIARVYEQALVAEAALNKEFRQAIRAKGLDQIHVNALRKNALTVRRTEEAIRNYHNLALEIKEHVKFIMKEIDEKISRPLNPEEEVAVGNFLNFVGRYQSVLHHALDDPELGVADKYHIDNPAAFDDLLKEINEAERNAEVKELAAALIDKVTDVVQGLGRSVSMLGISRAGSLEPGSGPRRSKSIFNAVRKSSVAREMMISSRAASVDNSAAETTPAAAPVDIRVEMARNDLLGETLESLGSSVNETNSSSAQATDSSDSTVIPTIEPLLERDGGSYRPQ